MRKAIRHLLLLAAVLWGMSLHGQGGLRPRGDVNCDWEVGIADVNALVDAVVRGTAYHSLYTYCHDINGDREINIADVNMLIDGLLGGELPPLPSFSGTLPVLYINTAGYRDIVSKEKEDYLQAHWWLDAMGLEGYESLGSASEPLGMVIKGRGNYTWTNFEKRSFRIKLDSKEPLMGMPANRHWNLMANADYWMGELNDAIPFEIGRRMGMAWNPRQEPVEVVLNGQYIGLYFLTEKIRVGKHRVNIDEQADGETDADLVTGGWLLEIDNYYDPGHIFIHEGNGTTMMIHPHSPDSLSDVQRDYITDFLKAADAAIYCTDKTSTEWERYVDIDSLAIFYVIQEIVDNPESFAGSCFMYKGRGEDSKLVFGPLWDGGGSYSLRVHDYQFNQFIYDDVVPSCQQHWIAEIAKYQHFQSRVRHYWRQFRDEVYPSIDDYADTLLARIEQAGLYDNRRWSRYSGAYTSITYRYNRYYRDYFHRKVAWLDSQWGEDSILK